MNAAHWAALNAGRLSKVCECTSEFPYEFHTLRATGSCLLWSMWLHVDADVLVRHSAQAVDRKQWVSGNESQALNRTGSISRADRSTGRAVNYKYNERQSISPQYHFRFRTVQRESKKFRLKNRFVQSTVWQSVWQVAVRAFRSVSFELLLLISLLWSALKLLPWTRVNESER